MNDMLVTYCYAARLRAKNNEQIRNGADWCLLQVQFKGSCQLAVIGGFRSVYFVAEKPSSFRIKS